MDPDCRRAFPSDPSAWGCEPATWLADLAALRHAGRALRDGELTLLRAEGAALAYLRQHEADAYACILNAADEPLACDLRLPVTVDSANVEVLRCERQGGRAQLVGDRVLHVELPARHGAIVRLQPAGRPPVGPLPQAEPILAP